MRSETENVLHARYVARPFTVEVREPTQPIFTEQLNPFSLIVAHKEVSREMFRYAPKKIVNRLRLTDYGWCRLGTIFVPPGDYLTQEEIPTYLNELNKMNQEGGRPNDTDVIIRTALDNPNGVAPTQKRNISQPAFLIENAGSEQQCTLDLESFEAVDYKNVMLQNNNRWKMIHSDNLPLQMNAIHAKLFNDDGHLILEMGSNFPHARLLDNGGPTTVVNAKKLGYSFSANGTFRPDLIKIHGNLSNHEVEMFIHKYEPFGSFLENFTYWMDTFSDTPSYVAEARHYPHHCYPSEQSHIMDVDTRM